MVCTFQNLLHAVLPRVAACCLVQANVANAAVCVHARWFLLFSLSHPPRLGGFREGRGPGVSNRWAPPLQSHPLPHSRSPFALVRRRVSVSLSLAKRGREALCLLAWPLMAQTTGRRWGRGGEERTSDVVLWSITAARHPISVGQTYVWMRLCLIVHDNNTPLSAQACFTRWSVCGWVCVCVCVWLQLHHSASLFPVCNNTITLPPSTVHLCRERTPM